MKTRKQYTSKLLYSFMAFYNHKINCPGNLNSPDHVVI